MKKYSLTLGFINIYLLVLLLILIGSGAAVYGVYHRPVALSQKATTPHQTVIAPSPTPSLSPTVSTNVSTPSVTSHFVVHRPTISLASASIEVEDQRIYLVQGNDKQVLAEVNKTNSPYGFPTTFESAQLSPDKSGLLLAVNDGYSYPVRYYVDLNQTDKLMEIGITSHEVWSPNGRYIVTTSGAGDCGPQNVHLNLFDTKSGQDSSLKGDEGFSVVKDLDYDMMLYDISGWLPDSSGLKIHYTAFKDGGCSGERKQVGEGTVIIKIPQQ